MTDASNAQTEQPQQTYQEAITRIQEIVRLLETGDIEVDELTQLIEEATGLLHTAHLYRQGGLTASAAA